MIIFLRKRVSVRSIECGERRGDEVVFAKQRAEMVSLAIAELPIDQLQIGRLAFIQDLSQPEITEYFEHTA